MKLLTSGRCRLDYLDSAFTPLDHNLVITRDPWSRPATDPARTEARSGLVADASGAPVLRDQGPIGRPGTARPMQASTVDHLLAKSDRPPLLPVGLGNGAGRGGFAVVRGCPLDTEVVRLMWHVSGT